VRRLTQVYVVVGVNEVLFPLAAEDLGRPCGNDFVRVRVGRCARAGLKDIDHELAVERPRGDLGRRLFDGAREAGVDETEIEVDASGGLLDKAEGTDET